MHRGSDRIWGPFKRNEIAFIHSRMYDPVATAPGFGNGTTKIMKLKSLIFLMLALAATTVQAQEPWPQERSEQREKAVINEDGGRSYLVLPAASPLVGLAKPGAGIADLQQHSIFLGSGWADPALRAREARLSKLLATIHDHAQLDEIAQAGFTNRFGPTLLTEPQADSVYIVFLDPGLQSTLRSLTAGKHYLAYHSFFNASGSKVHYAVVPYQSDSTAAYQIALRTLVVAALHTAENPQ